MTAPSVLTEQAGDGRSIGVNSTMAEATEGCGVKASGFTVKPEAFTPAPAVSSAIVEFTPIEQPSPACSVKTLGAVTAAAFGQRRKMLRQSLKSLLPEPEPLLAAAGIAPTLRGEALSVADFARLAYVFERLGPRSPF